MKHLLVMALVCACLTGVLSPVSAEISKADDERASAFVAGAADPDETFAPMEGLVLLILAGLAVLVSFSLLLYSVKTHQRGKIGLDAIDGLLRAKDDPHA